MSNSLISDGPISNRPIIGVGVLVWRKKQLLLGKRISNGEESSWQFPGGHLEAGESVTDCARREVQEETGLIVKSFRHIGYTDRPFIVSQKNYLTLFVSCISDMGEAEVMEPDKCADWSWFDDGQLPQPLFEPISLFLDQHGFCQQASDQQAPDKNISSPAGLYELHCSSGEIPDIPLVSQK